MNLRELDFDFSTLLHGTGGWNAILFAVAALALAYLIVLAVRWARSRTRAARAAANNSRRIAARRYRERSWTG
jgi:hypothetical protein